MVELNAIFLAKIYVTVNKIEVLHFYYFLQRKLGFWTIFEIKVVG